MTELIISNINKYIEQNHIKQTWIADALNTNKMNISNILTGKKKNVTFDELVAIAGVLDLQFDDLCKGEFFTEVPQQQTMNNENPEYMAFCGNIENTKTKETINLVMDLIDIIDVFKSANEYAVVK